MTTASELHRRAFSRIVSVLSALLLLAAVVLPSCALAASVPGELLIRLRRAPVRGSLDDVARADVGSVDAMVQAHRATLSAPLARFAQRFSAVDPVILLRTEPALNMDSLAAVVAADPNVAWASPNRIFRGNSLDDGAILSDSLYADEWWLSKISAPAAWEITHGDSGIVIGIIDTGIDYKHPDLLSKIWRNWAEQNGTPGVDDDNNGFVDDSIGWDFVDAPALPSSGDHLVRDSDPMDQFGHGTYVAGIAAAAPDNQSCIAGVGYSCRVMPLRAGNAEGYLEEDDIAAALLYGAQMGARIINMSFGDVVASPLLRETVQLAYQAGVTLVASAGNAQSDVIHYPSGYPEVISVGATDHNDFRASFSNYGPSVTVMAPGLDFKSTILGGECGPWGSSAGTSYATPVIAAVAGLVLTVNPQLSPNDIKQLLRTTADDVRESGWDPATVNGRVNALRAVEQASYGADVVARITSPRTDQGMLADFVVRGEAWGAAFTRWDLFTGLGEDPTEWSFVSGGNERVYGDTLGTVQLPAQDTVMTLRLSSSGASGSVSHDFVHLFIQRAAPQIDSLRIRRMLDQDTYGDLVQVWSSQMTGATLILTNTQGDSVRQEFGYVSREHAGVLSQREHPGVWQVRVRLTNTAGLSTESAPFTFQVNDPPFTSNLYTRAETNLTHGYVAPFTTDFDCDGRPELWRLPIHDGGLVSDLEVAQWNGQDFSDTLAAVYGIYIPQAVGDADNDGLKEFMARRSSSTRIWEQTDSCGPFDHVVFEDTTNFTCADFFDFDSTDSRGNILAWTLTAESGVERPRYVIFAVGDNYALTPVDTIPNNTPGGNNLGSPKMLIGDLNRNGILDFVYGDYDGDVIFCEKDGNSVVQKWSARLPLDDATSWLARGDFDGDGEDEFVAGCRTAVVGGSESQLHSLHWEYFVFKHVLADSFAVADTILIQGNAPVGDHPASVNAADVDGDGRSEILISAFPDYYIIKRDAASGRFTPVWYQTPAEANVSLVTDWDGDGLKEIFASDGTRIQRIQYAGGSGTRPHPPLNFSGTPLNVNTIRLTWNRAGDADSYQVYYAHTVPHFSPLAATADTTLVLTDVPTGVTFTYAVASVRPSLPDTFSVLSNYAEVTAHEFATVEDTARYVAPHFVELRFSAAMGPSAMYQWAYHLDDDSRMPAVVSPGEGGRRIFLMFEGGFTPGTHTLRLSGLYDALGGVLTDHGNPPQVVFNVADSVAFVPRVLSHRVLGATPSSAVEITFTDPMSESVLNAANYRLAYLSSLQTTHAVLSVEAAETDRHRVVVHLDPRYPVGALGLPARLFLRNITNAAGVALDTTAGQSDVVVGGAASSLDDAYVFPNPYKGNGAGGEPGILFAALPVRATIRVFTIQGTLVRKLEHRSDSGAARWDLTNEDGEAVAGGVYLYTIESDGHTVRGKLAVLR